MTRERQSRSRQGTPRLEVVLSSVIVLVTVLAYWNSFGGVFVLDDAHNIVNNEQIRSLSNIREILVERRPLVTLSLALNYSLGKLNTWGYHLFNLIVHILAALTLFGVVRRGLCLPWSCHKNTTPSTRIAFATTVIWAVHPLQTESVTYIYQRAESMMGLFYLLILYGIIRSASSSRPPAWHLATVLCAALGMACKPVIVTAPLVAVTLDRLFLATSFSQLVRRRGLVYLAMTAILAVVAVGTSNTSYIFGRITSPLPEVHYFRATGALEYWVSQPGVVVHYLRLAFWPDALCLDYRWRPATEILDIVPPTIVILGLLTATVVAVLRRSALGFLGAWFFIVLAPTSAMWPLELAFEHRMYLPLAAVVLLIVIGMHRAFGTVCRHLPRLEPVSRLAAVTLTLGGAFALGYRTSIRNEDYNSLITMNQAVLRVRPDNDRAHYNLGNAWSREGSLGAAIAAYQAALNINPRHGAARCNLANRYVQQGKLDEAVAEYERVLEFDPSHFRATMNLASALTQLARRESAAGNSITAHTLLVRTADLCRRAMELAPTENSPRTALADALRRLGNMDEADTLLHAPPATLSVPRAAPGQVDDE